MKRKASRPAPYEVPAKLTKRTTSATVSRKLSTLKRAATSVRPPMPPPKWPSLKSKTPSLPRSPSLPLPKWPTLVPTGRGRKESDPSGDMTEISVESPTRVPGLRRMSTLPLEEERVGLSREGSRTMSKAGSRTELSKAGSQPLSRTGSSLSEVPAVATLEKKDSVVTLDTGGTVTTVTRLASGSSTGETTGLALAAPSIRKELSKAAGSATPQITKPSLPKKVSSIRVWGTDAPEDEPPSSLSRGSSKSSKAGSVRKEASRGPSTSSAPAVPLPPGGLIEIVFSFDTTGSMSSCIDEVRGRVGDMVQRLQADIPGIRIAVMAHGDYCDADFFYVIKWIDFGASVSELCNFVQTISGTGGGDFDECYELAMARARTELSWTPGSQRSLVMIGDATPHPPSYYNTRDEKLDWQEEAKKLADMDVKIYAVQALNNSTSTPFYRSLAQMTRGRHLRLDQFNNIFDMLMVLCYNERGADFVQAYEDEVRTREGSAGLNKDLEGLFSAIRGGKPSEAALKVLSKGAAKGKAAAKKAAGSKTPAKKTAGKTAAKAVGKATAKKVSKATGKKAATGKKTSKATGKKATKATGKKATKATGKKASKATAKASAKAAAKKARGKGVKSVKGRKPIKTASKKKKTTTKKTKSKKPVPGVTRKFREAVPDKDFEQGSCMKSVEWSDWVKAIFPSLPRGRDGPKFKERYNPSNTRSKKLPTRQGLRNQRILDDGRNAPAVYEIAVQLKAKKRYVVFFKVCRIWRANVFWDTVLFTRLHLHQEVNAVIKAGGQIWLRRGNVPSVDKLIEVKRHVRKLYDYAWEKRKLTRGRGFRVRRLKKCNKLISGNSGVSTN